MGDTPVIPLVVDNGSCSCKAGLANKDDPQVVFSSVIGRSLNPRVMMTTARRNYYVGEEAQLKRGILSLKYPMERGIVTDWDDMIKIWEYTFNQLDVTPANHPLLLTEPVMNPTTDRERMAQIMFETFGFAGVYIATQPVLSLLASGYNTGIVLECGDGLSQIVPCYDGHVIPQGIIRQKLAGMDLTNYLSKLLVESGHSLTTTAEREIVRDIKEKLCYVALDFKEAMTTDTDVTNLRRPYTLPDGQVIEVGRQRFSCLEALFQPTLLGLEFEGIHADICNSIKKCSIDTRKHLFTNVIVSGGTTMCPGFDKRLQKEIKSLVPSTIAVNVRTPPKRQHAVWKGGTIFTSQLSNQHLWITPLDYNENGSRLFQRRGFY